MAPGPNFLETMRIPLLEGRTFTAQDFETAAKKNAAIRDHMAADATGKPWHADGGESIVLPALVNRAFVQKYLPTENPLERDLYAGAA